MAYEQKPNSGSLFVNDKKEADNHPDFRGSALIDGREVWVSGWRKKTKDGKHWLSLAFKPKDERASVRDDAGQGPVDLDDDIPFAPEWR